MEGYDKVNALNEKMAYQAEKQAYDNSQLAQGIAGCNTNSYQPPTLRMQAEKNAAHHFDQHVKAQQAASFLTAHPEFDEFIRLIRSGAIQILFLALCAVSAFAQAPPSPEPQLSTAEKTAIQSLEKQKQDAQTSYQQALQTEMTIAREFGMTHVGYHLDAQNFSVQKDPVAPVPPTPEKK